jgi:hypothetical protein
MKHLLALPISIMLLLLIFDYGYCDGWYYKATKEASVNYSIAISIAGIAIGLGIYFGLRSRK